jgi:hypothetical protein
VVTVINFIVVKNGSLLQFKTYLEEAAAVKKFNEYCESHLGLKPTIVNIQRRESTYREYKKEGIHE